MYVLDLHKRKLSKAVNGGGYQETSHPQKEKRGENQRRRVGRETGEERR